MNVNLKLYLGISLFLGIWCGSHVFAQSPESLFSQGNALFQQQQFENAIEMYQQILSMGFESKEIYYNLGNCYYRLEDVGKSILFYEKALKLDPNDPDIRYNLDLANLKVIDRLELPPRFFLFEWWEGIKTYYSIPQLTRLVAALFISCIFLIVIWLFIKRDRIRFWILTAVSGVGLLTIFYAYILVIQSQSFINHRYAVILASTVTVVSAPDENSTDVFILHEGAKVHLDESRQEWVKISLPDGKSGWLLAQNLGII